MHVGQFAAMDVDTGEFEIDQDEMTACDRLLARLPDCANLA